MSTSTTTRAPSPLPPRVAPLPPMRPKTPTVQAPALRPAASAAAPASNLLTLHAAYGNGAVARAFAPRTASPTPIVSLGSRTITPQPPIMSPRPAAPALAPPAPAAKVQALPPQAPPKVEPPPKLSPTPAEPTAKTETKPPAHEHKDDKATAAHPPAESKKPSVHAATAPGKDQTKGPADAKKAPKEKPTGAPHTPPVGEKPETRAKGEAGEKPVVMHPTSAHADPAFQAVVGRVHHAAGKLKTHAPAHAKAEQAQKAATVDPGAEAHSRAAAGQVDAMDQVKPKPFDRAAFVAAVKKEVEKATPKTLGDVDEFKKRGTASEIKPNLAGQVDAGKREAQGDIPERVAAVPDPSGVKTDPVTPLPPEAAAPAPADIHADAAVPTPRPDAEVSLQAGSASLDQKMTDAHVSDEQLRRSNEPSFQGALKAKGEAKANAAAAPHAFRQGEQATLSHAKGEAHATAQAQMGGLHAAHGQATGHVGAQQAAAKAQAEKERTDFIQKLEGIYQEAKKNVEDCLNKLDVDVNLAFDQGAVAAQKAFEDEVDTNITQFKLIRYGTSLGALWLADYILGPPPEVEQFYRTARDNYIKAMDAVLANIAMIVDTGLADAKTKVSEGKTKIQSELKLLPKSLQAFGQEAARNIQGKFDQLEQSVDAKQGQLIDSLAQKYSENLQQVDAKITAMKEADRGLISKASEAIDGAIEAIINMKNMLVRTLAKAGDAIDLIIADPIGFLANLASAVKQGFMNFVGKIGTYLEQGLMGWLFGVLEDAGIKIPATLDLKSIFGVACQVLGLTYANIRSRAVKIVGPKVVAALETAAEIFMILKNEGPAGLWKWIKEKLTNFKDMVIGAIKQWVVTKVIMAGVNWVISLLNPASAFVKACIAIYDIIMFFVENGKRILTLVNAVIDSVTAIAKGSLGAAAAFVENSLAGAVPLVISFLADLLGLGGVSEAIKGVIERAREYVNIAIDWVINKAVEMVKAIGSLLGFGKKDDEAKPVDPEHDAKVAKGLQEMDELDATYAKNGAISKPDAKKVAAKVKADNPIFKSITVVEGDGTWDYDYVASDGKHTGVRMRTGQLTVSTVKVKDPGIAKKVEEARAESGLKYEEAVKSAVVKDILKPEWQKEIGLPIQLVVKGQKEFQYESTQDMPRLKLGKGHRAPGELRFPEGTLEVKVPRGGGELQEVRVIEVTLIEDFDSQDDFTVHKVDQFNYTMQIFKEKYDPDVPITYYFLAPREPTEKTKGFIEETLTSKGMSNVHVEWKIIETK